MVLYHYYLNTNKNKNVSTKSEYTIQWYLYIIPNWYDPEYAIIGINNIANNKYKGNTAFKNELIIIILAAVFADCCFD